MVNIMKKELVFSGLLVLLVCMLLGCGQQSKEHGVKSSELKVESKELKAEAKEQPNIQPKKEINQNKSKLSQKEEKKIEKRVLEIVNRLEKIRGNFLEMLVKEEKVKEEEKLKKELKEIDKEKICVPIILNIIKNKKKDWMVRSFFISLLINEINIKNDEITKLLIEIANDPKEDILLQKDVTDTLQEDFGITLPKAKLSDKEIEKKVKRLIREINLVCMFIPNIDFAIGISGFYGQDIEGIGSPAIPILVREFANRWNNWKTRFYLGMLIEKCRNIEYSNNVAEVLGKILENKREKIWIRWGAAKGLIAGGDKAIEPLVRVLKTIEPFLGNEEVNQKDKIKENFCRAVLYSLGNLLENSKEKELIDEAIDAVEKRLDDTDLMVIISA
ncbi:MAG: hypothetical protein QME42_09695, partial [bacterium]|nr:hypothetical protein [bacterium]